MKNNEQKIWKNGLTCEETIERYNEIFRKVELKHLKKFHKKHRTDIVSLIYAGKIKETELD